MSSGEAERLIYMTELVEISKRRRGGDYFIYIKSAWREKVVDELVSWCLEHDVDIKGQFLYIKDDETFTLFKMAWL